VSDKPRAAKRLETSEWLFFDILEVEAQKNRHQLGPGHARMMPQYTDSQRRFACSLRVSTACTAHSTCSMRFESRLRQRLGWHFTSAETAALPEDALGPHPQGAMHADAISQAVPFKKSIL